MQINTETRTDDVRALAVAMASGCMVGLIVAGAYLAGSSARPAVAAGASAVPPALALSGPAPARPGSSGVRSSIGSTPDQGVGAQVRPGLVTALHDGAPFADADTGDRRCLAQAVYYEARGESPTGQAAVAQVVLNRVRLPRFPKSLCGVVYQRSGDACQFSFACNGAMRGAVDETAWRRAEQVAGRVLHGAGVAEVRGATMFQAVSAAGRGGVAGGLMQVAQIGAHVFYRLTGHDRGSGFAAPAIHRDLGRTDQDGAEPQPIHVVFQGPVSPDQPSSSLTPAPGSATPTSSTLAPALAVSGGEAVQAS